MSQIGRIQFPILALLALLLQTRASTIIRPLPKFGAPIVISNTLVFTSPQIHPPKVFGIDRATGKRLWETPLTNTPIHAWSAPPQVLISSGSKLFNLNPTNGDLRELLDTKMEIKSIKPIDQSHALIRGEAEREDHLIAIARANGDEKWRLTNILEILDHDSHKILILSGARKNVRTDFPGYPVTDPDSEVLVPHYTQVALLSADTGRKLWRHPLKEPRGSYSGVLVANYAILSGIGRIACFSIDDGSVRTNIPAARAEDAVALWKEDKRVYGLIGHGIFSLDYPTLKLRPLNTFKNPNQISFIQNPQFYGILLVAHGFHAPLIFQANTGKPLWPTTPIKFENSGGFSDAHFDWNGVHDGFIYYSRANKDRALTTINALSLTNFTAKELFSSPIPITAPRSFNLWGQGR